MYDITDWPVLQSLSEEFVSNIKFAHIYGTSGDQVIFITNDDDVYSFGPKNNANGSLGLGHTNAVPEPTKIEELCQKQVTQIKFNTGSNIFVLALTKNGTVFAWGYNGNGELGNGNTTAQYKPINVFALNEKNVTDIKAGSIHSLALTVSGDVYIWGHTISDPRKLDLNSPKQKIIAISMGVKHALALTESGDVYFWGDNQYGQCGNGNNNSFVNCLYWSQTPFLSKSIAKIACGPYHSLLLSSDGVIYCYGLNDVGQCGDSTNTNRNTPTKLNGDVKFKDIGAVKNCHVSVGLAESGALYYWGLVSKQLIFKPMKVL